MSKAADIVNQSRHFLSLALTMWLMLMAWTLFTLATPAAAQSPFSPAMIVDGNAITYFEIEQRKRLLSVMASQSTDLDNAARESLITERLRWNEFVATGGELSPEAAEQAVSDFAQRANFTAEEFIAILEQRGVDEQSFRDFVRADVAWAMLVRQRFGSNANVSDAEITSALGRTAQSSRFRVLLSELFLPAPPGDPARVLRSRTLAEELSEIRSEEEFSQKARELSIAPTRQNGGQLGWVELLDLPSSLQGVVLGLSPGQVSTPLPLQDRIGLIQLRAIEELPEAPAQPAFIDYAVLSLGQGDAAQTPLNDLALTIDTCEDLYGVSLRLENATLDRIVAPPEDIPWQQATALGQLDENEISLAGSASNGELIMLCSRTFIAGDTSPEIEDIRMQLMNQRLQNFANGYLAKLRAAAVIEIL